MDNFVFQNKKDFSEKCQNQQEQSDQQKSKLVRSPVIQEEKISLKNPSNSLLSSNHFILPKYLTLNRAKSFSFEITERGKRSQMRGDFWTNLICSSLKSANLKILFFQMPYSKNKIIQ